MPRERLDKKIRTKHPDKVYVDLQSLIKLQYQIRGFSFLPKQPVQSLLTGKYRSKLRGRGLDFEEVRAYVHGDDIRNIDWKVTAHTGKPHTKVYTEERERPVFIIVDQSAPMFFGSSNRLKSVTAAQAAAISAWKVLAVGDRVGGIVFGDQDFEEIKPQRDRKALQRFLQLIAEKNQQLSIHSYKSHNPAMLNHVLDKALNLVNHDYLLLIISDFSGFDAHTMKALILLSHHNDVILIRVYDPMEATLPEGELVLSDGQMQAVVNTNDQNLRTQFSRYFSERTEELHNRVKMYGMTLLEINTIDSITDQIRNLLTAGKQRKKVR